MGNAEQQQPQAQSQPPQPTPAAQPQPSPPVEERTIWNGTPSQLINFPVFFMCAIAAGGLIGGAVLLRERSGDVPAFIMGGLAIIPLLLAFWRYLKTRSCRYHLTNERLQMSYGVLSRKTEDLELYRVKDYHVSEPFIMRVFGLADVVLNTMDEANPTVMLKAIPRGARLRDDIRKHVELCRDRKRVRVAEFES
jgi:uncharacterized membrane protein YdbT with pleckstrin-like domain